MGLADGATGTSLAVTINGNAAKRAIKPFAVGRKNWLFFSSDRRDQTLALQASFTATCRQFGIVPRVRCEIH